MGVPPQGTELSKYIEPLSFASFYRRINVLVCISESVLCCFKRFGLGAFYCEYTKHLRCGVVGYLLPCDFFPMNERTTLPVFVAVAAIDGPKIPQDEKPENRQDDYPPRFAVEKHKRSCQCDEQEPDCTSYI